MKPTGQRRVLIEGWRFSTTSLAVLNMYQLIEMVSHPGIEIYHRDLPTGVLRLERRRGIWSDEDESRVAAIAEPPPEVRLDATLRIAFPMSTLADPQSNQTFVFGLAEYGIIEKDKCGGVAVVETLRRRDIQFITSSEFSRQGFLRSGAPPERVHVVPLGIDPAVMRPVDVTVREQLRAKYGWSDRFIVLHVSTFSLNKGVGQLLIGFSHFVSRNPEALLVLKCNSPFTTPEEALKSVFEQLPSHVVQCLQNRIVFLGKTFNFCDMASLYQSADIYAAPYIGEGFNLPVLEAAACGLPSICTASGPTDEFTTEEFCLRIPSQVVSNAEIEQLLGLGATILLPDVEQFARLLSFALENTSWRTRASQAATRQTHQQFTWTKTTQRLLKLLLP